MKMPPASTRAHGASPVTGIRQERTSLSAISFASHYTPEQYARYAEVHSSVCSAAPVPLSANSWFEVDSAFEAAVLSYLLAKGAAGELSPVPFCEGRGLGFVTSWGRLAAGEPLRQFDDEVLTENMSSLASMAVITGKSYAELIESVHAGMPLMAAGECQVTGFPVRVRLVDWTPVPGCFMPVDDRLVWTEMTEGPPEASVRHLELLAPSGELLLADWFRLEGFDEIVSELTSDRGGVSSAHGQEAASALYATRAGFMSVAASDQDASVVVRVDGRIEIGVRASEEDAPILDGTEVGVLDSDLWWVSAIDRLVLTDLLARKAGPEVALARVAKYVESGGPTVVRVPPGTTLHVYFESQHHLQKRYSAPGVNASGFERLYAVVSPEPLEWSLAAAPLAMPRP